MALVTYTGKNVFGVGLSGGELVRLMPGINEVEDSKLELMKTHPLFQSRIQMGLVNIMVDSPSKDGKRTVEDMLKHIPNIFDIRLLKKIIDFDGRDRVVKAANDQLYKIKNPAKAKEEADNAHFV